MIPDIVGAVDMNVTGIEVTLLACSTMMSFLK